MAKHCFSRGETGGTRDEGAFPKFYLRENEAISDPASPLPERGASDSARERLSHPQTRIFLDQLRYPESPLANISFTVSFQSAPSAERIEAAINAVLREHDALRLRFVMESDEPAQYIAKYFEHDFEVLEFPSMDDPSYLAWAETNARRRFELWESEMFSFAILLFQEGGSGFFAKLHHLVHDGFSTALLVGEVERLMETLPGEVTERSASYFDFLRYEEEYLASTDFEEHRRRWLDIFTPFPEVAPLFGESSDTTAALNESASPWENVREDAPSRDAEEASRTLATSEIGAELRRFYLPAALDAKIAGFCGSRGVTLFSFFLSLAALYFCRTWRRKEVLINFPYHGRHLKSLRRLCGMFVGDVPFRASVMEGESFHSMVRRIHGEIRALLRGACRYPFELLAKDMQERSLDLSQAIELTMTEIPQVQAGRSIRYHANGDEAAKFNIWLNRTREGDGSFEYTVTCWKRSVSSLEVERFWARMSLLIGQVLANPDLPVEELSLVGEEEREELLFGLNSTSEDYPLDRTVGELFAETARAWRDRTALVFKERRYTYAEVDRLTDALASRLAATGGGPEEICAIFAERSEDTILAMLAVLKAGAAFLPIDPAYPDERVEYMLRDSGARILLCHAQDRERGFAFEGERIDLRGSDGSFGFAGSEAPPRHPCPASSSSLAYVIYTSGSTGNPKGVMVEHRNLINLCMWHRDFHRVTERDVSATYSGFSFDASLWEIFPFLLRGAAVHVIPEEIRLSIEGLDDYFNRHGVTLVNLPTQICEYFMESVGASSLRTLVTGGDKLRFYRPVPYRVVNEYGPTECTISATVHVVERSAANIPIGAPLANTRLYVVDEKGVLVPRGAPGELWISGAQVARGYLGRPELTAEKFIPNPFATCELDGRVYRTGDLVRWNEDGEIEFLGRIDSQVKLRGYRIELGEIEQRLLKVEGVKDAVAGVSSPRLREAGSEGTATALCAWMVFEPGADASVERVKRELVKALPEYMVPTFFTVLDRIPLTPNGKVDRRALPAPLALDDGGAREESAFVEPRTPVERRLALLWAEALTAGVRPEGSRGKGAAPGAIGPIGCGDEFVKLGGDSLGAVRLQSKMRREFGVEVSVADIFGCATLEKLAAFVEEGGGRPSHPAAPVRSAVAAVGRVSSGGEMLHGGAYPSAALHGATPAEPFPLSVGQLAFFFVSGGFERQSAKCIVPLLFKIEGSAPEPERLERALKALIARHEALRTRFVPDEKRGVLQFVEREVPFVLERLKTDALDLQRIARPMDLRIAPLFRVVLAEVSGGPANDCVAKEGGLFLFVFAHHIVFDGVSADICMRELTALYEAEEPESTPSPVQFREYALWMDGFRSSEEYRKQEMFWLNTYADGIPVLDLPGDFPEAPSRGARRGFEGMHRLFTARPALLESLRSFAERNGATLFHLLLSAWLVALTREALAQSERRGFFPASSGKGALSGAESAPAAESLDIVVGVPVSGRPMEKFQETVGMFVNTLALRIRCEAEDFSTLLRKVRDVSFEALENQQYQYADLVAKLRAEHGTGNAPLFRVLFSFQTSRRPTRFESSRSLGFLINAGGAFSSCGAFPQNGGDAFALRLLPVETHAAQADLGLEAEILDGELQLSIEYSTHLFRDETAGKIGERLLEVLESVAATPETTAKESEASVESGVRGPSSRSVSRKSVEYAPPRDERESILLSIWEEILGVKGIGINHDYFRLGGDSIRTIQLSGRLAKHGWKLDGEAVFEAPTVAQLAPLLQPSGGERRGPVSGPVPLTPIQRWFFEQPLKRRDRWNQSVLLRSSMPDEKTRRTTVRKPPDASAGQTDEASVWSPAYLDEQILAEALADVVEHHDALRMVYRFSGEGLPGQFNRGAGEGTSFLLKSFELPASTTAGTCPASLSAEIESRAEELQCSLDIRSGPLLAAGIFNTGASGDGSGSDGSLSPRKNVSGQAPSGQSYLAIIVHHLVIDGVSWSILLQDLETAYLARLNKEKPLFAPRTVSYKEWAEKSEEIARSWATAGSLLWGEVDYWRGIDGSGSDPLPLDFADSARLLSESAARHERGEASFRFDAEETSKLFDDGRNAFDLTAEELLLSAFSLALNRWSEGRLRNVAVTLEGHGRSDIFGLDVSRTVGWFTATYPALLPVTLSAESPDEIGTLCAEVRRRLRSVPNRGIGYELLHRAGGASWGRLRPEIEFNYLGEIAGASAAGGGRSLLQVVSTQVGGDSSPEEVRDFPLLVSATLESGALVLSLTHGAHFLPGTVRRLAARIEEALREIGGYCSGLEATADAERRMREDIADPELTHEEFEEITGYYGPDAIERIYPLAPMQEGMLFLDLMAGGDSLEYLEQSVYEFRGACPASAGEDAFSRGEMDERLFVENAARMIRHFDILRTGFFVLGNGRMRQVLLRDVAPVVEFARVDEPSCGAGPQAVQAFAVAEREKRFDMRRPPLLRILVLASSESEVSYVVVTFRHIILDGWSMEMIKDFLFGDYALLKSGEPVPPRLAVPYARYVDWLAAQDADASVRFWRDALAGFESPSLVPEVAGAPVFGVSSVEEAHASVVLTLPQRTGEGLAALAASCGVTMNAVLATLWAIVLMRCNRSDDVVFGLVTSGRAIDVPNVGEIAGLFINTVPFRVRAEAATTLEELLIAVRRNISLAEKHSHTSLAVIQQNSPLRSDLIGTHLTLQGRGESEKALPAGFALREIDGFDRMSYGFSVVICPEAVSNPRISVGFDFDTSKYDRRFVESLARSFALLAGRLGGETQRTTVRKPPDASADQTDEASVWSTAYAEAADTLLRGIELPVAEEDESNPFSVRSALARRVAPPEDAGRTEDVLPPVRSGGDVPEHLQRAIMDVWKKVLGLEHVAADDNFFAVGGDSIKAVEAVFRLSKMYEITLRDIFLASTPASLARRLTAPGATGARAGATADGAAPSPLRGKSSAADGPFPLSSPQKRIYVLNRMQADTSYNVTTALRIDGPLDRKRFSDAIDAVIARHDILRTSYEIDGAEADGGSPLQRVHPQVRLKKLFKRVEEDDIREAVIDFVRPFDLSEPPPIRVMLLEISRTSHVFLMDVHHIAMDGISTDIFFDELFAIYRGERLPEVRSQYGDYCALEESAEFQGMIKARERYWLERFADGVPRLELPYDRPRPAVRSSEGALRTFRFDEGTTRALRSLAACTGSTMFMLMLALFNVLLRKWCRSEDIVVGTPSSGRGGAEFERTIGMFVNTLALRNAPEGAKSFSDFLGDVKNTSIDAFENGAYPFDYLVDALGVKRDPSRSPIFDVMFGYERLSPPTLPGFEVSPVEWDAKSASFDLVVEVFEENEAIDVQLEYSTALFDEPTIRGLEGHLRRIVQRVVEEPSVRIGDIDILTDSERHELLLLASGDDLHGLAPDSADIDATFHSLFRGAVSAFPERTALVYEGRSSTYRTLDEITDALALRLRGEGVVRGTICALLLERSEEIVIGMLAIMKAGGAFLPIDPAYPDERVRFMITDSGAVAVFGHASQRARVEELGIRWIASRSFLDDGVPSDPEAPQCVDENEPGDPLYVIYTSGSTGKPKGVMVEHRSFVSLCMWHREYHGVTEADRSAAYSGFSFDASLWEMLPFLLCGAQVHILPEGIRLSIKGLADSFSKRGITIVNLPTQLCERFMEAGVSPPSLRTIVTGGDKLRLARPEGASYRLVNEYGPTEYAVSATAFEVEKAEANIPIGRPLARTWAYIVDPDGRLAPPGVPGELWISGAQIARGYLNRPRLTEEKFVENPFSDRPMNVRAYRTGDLARWRRDGNLEYLGRVDQQVKIRGYRIELGEIEQALRRIESVVDAAVLDVAGGTALAAYIVTTGGSFGAPDEKALREELSRTLPEYMIPSRFIALERMPLTPNGKVDRRALPEAVLACAAAYAEPATDAERRIAEIWRKVLGVERPGLHDNFFELGGNSIKAIQAVSLSSRSFDISINDMFEHQTLFELANAVSPKRGQLEARLAAIKEAAEASEARTLDAETEALLRRDGERYFARCEEEIAAFDLSEREGYGHVLLTGATGFLGAHILHRLLHSPEGVPDITLIVRAADDRYARERVIERLRYYFPGGFEDASLLDGVRILAGDLSREDFGISPEAYAALAEKGGAIIHAAANVRHYGRYEDFRRDNVLTTSNLLRLAKRGAPKDVHYISTISVGSGALEGKKAVLFTEYDGDIEVRHDNVYLKSKAAAEKEVLAARSAGVRTSIYRVGNIVFNSTTGIHQENIEENAFYSLLKAYMNLGVTPESEDAVDLSFVDGVAEAICGIYDRKALRNGIYHIANPATYSTAEILGDPATGLSLERLPFGKFLDYLRDHLNAEGMAAYIDLVMTHSGWLDDFTGQETSFEVRTERTEAILKALGFRWPEFSHSQLSPMIRSAFRERMELLRQLPFCAPLDGEPRSVGASPLLELAAGARWKLFGDGSPLLREGGEQRELYIVLDGAVEISASSVHGWTSTFMLVGRHSLLGGESFFLGGPSAVTAEAVLGDVSVLAFDHDLVRRTLMRNPQALAQLLGTMAGKIARLEKMIVSLA